MTEPTPNEEMNENEELESDELFDQLAAEEPPVEADDTNPSATKPNEVVTDSQAMATPSQSGGGMGSIAMVMFALIMVAIGGLLLLTQDEADPGPATPTAIVENYNPTLTPSDEPESATDTPVPTDSGPLPTAIANSELPTAAADEQMLALQTPVGGNASDTIGRDNAPFTEQISSDTSDAFVMYQIQRGDTLNKLEDRFNLDLCTIIWSNDRSKVSPLQPGAEIIIPPVDGVYTRLREAMTIAQLAEETGVDPFTIIDSPFNTVLVEAQPDSLLPEGYRVMVPEGSGGNCNVWGAGPSIVSGEGDDSSGGVSTSGTYNLWGCNATVSGGGFPAANPVGGSYVFFQGFSAGHTGVDLSASVGTPVFAAGAGTVVFAGWNSYGYGNTVVIAHAGTFTLYAHMDTIGVSCGQNVSGGQTIGTVGSTGRSSGPHLHFEIRDSGFNPLNPVYTIGF